MIVFVIVAALVALICVKAFPPPFGFIGAAICAIAVILRLLNWIPGLP